MTKRVLSSVMAASLFVATVGLVGCGGEETTTTKPGSTKPKATAPATTTVTVPTSVPAVPTSVPAPASAPAH